MRNLYCTKCNGLRTHLIKFSGVDIIIYEECSNCNHILKYVRET